MVRQALQPRTGQVSTLIVRKRQAKHGSSEDGITFAYTLGVEDHEQGIGPRRAGDGMPRPDIGGQTLF
jgi:hypothetical protein